MYVVVVGGGRFHSHTHTSGQHRDRHQANVHVFKLWEETKLP